MPRGSSTIYRVSHVRGWVVERLRLNDNTYAKARAGSENYRKNVAMQFRKRVFKDTGHDPGWIDFDHLVFVPLT